MKNTVTIEQYNRLITLLSNDNYRMEVNEFIFTDEQLMIYVSRNKGYGYDLIQWPWFILESLYN